MFQIGEFSKMGKTTVKTLRYYDEMGLLKPAYTDPVTHYRFYKGAQLVTLHQIQSLRQMGFSIVEIKEILENPSVDVLKHRRRELYAQLQKIQKQLVRIDFILSGKEEKMKMNYQATIKELPGCTVYAKELIVPGYDDYFKLIPTIGKQVTEKYPNIKCAISEYCFIIYLDGEYKEKNFKVEFCEAVDQLYEDFEDIHFKSMEPETVVSVMHQGPYHTISQAYAFIFRWIEENGYAISGNPRESYIDGIWNCDSDSQWLTELQIPIVK